MSQEDAAALLSEFVYQIDNLPAEVAFILEEIGWKDEKVQGELGNAMVWHMRQAQRAVLSGCWRATGLRRRMPRTLQHTLMSAVLACAATAIAPSHLLPRHAR